MATLLQNFETSFNRWASLDPRIEPRERQYLSAHAYCGLGDIADLAGRDWQQTVGCMQNRRGNGIALLDFVDPNMTVEHFHRHATRAWRSWLSELAEKNRPSRRQFAYAVREPLFAGNDAGWAEYVARVRQSVPWFDEAVPEDDDDHFRPRGGKLAMVVRVFFE